ncbi:MAG: hypothetical protein ACYS3S_24720, partial [Planctomycetota bacterium]
MSEIEKIIDSSRWGPFSANSKNVQGIIARYEAIWQNTALWGIYTNRVRAVDRLFVRKGDPKDTITKKGSDGTKKIFIYCKDASASDISPTASNADEIDYNMPELGKGSGEYDIAAAILMEMGNCVDEVDHTAQIRSDFYGGAMTLVDVGNKVAGEESHGMWDYIRLMREIPADQRPYQSNRDVYKNRQNQTITQFGKTFAGTPHQSFNQSASETALKSGETYQFDAIKYGTHENIKSVLNHAGILILGRTNTKSSAAWSDLVKLIAGKLGTSPQNNARLYLVCSGVLKSLVTANLGVGNP